MREDTNLSFKKKCRNKYIVYNRKGMLNQREITNDYGRDKTKQTQQAQSLGFDHPKLESFRRLASLFFFFCLFDLAKKTWTIVEGIRYDLRIGLF